MTEQLLVPETGDLVWTPRDAIQFGIVESVTASAYLLVRDFNGNTRRVDAEMVEAWYRPFWRRRRDLAEVLYRQGVTQEDRLPGGTATAQLEAAADLAEEPPPPPRRRRSG